MPLSKKVTILALTGFAAGCGQGNSDNVMSPQSNALTPAEVNEALGPETPVVAENNMLGTDMNGIGEQDENSPAVTESATNNSAE
jgi:hypothetical protein